MNMRRIVQIIVVIGWIGSFAWLLGEGRYKDYLGPTLWPVLVAGLVMGVAFLLAILRPDTGHTHHAGNGLLRAAICLLPLAYVFLSPRGSLGSYAFEKRFLNESASKSPGIAAPAPTAPAPEAMAQTTPTTAPAPATQPAAQAEPPVETNLMELTERFEGYKDLYVALEGMVFHQPNEPASRFVLFRFTISCCAADALPMGVFVFSDDAKKYEADTWVHVVGKAVMRDVDGKQRESIEATSLTKIEEPANPYLSSQRGMGMGY